MAGKQLVFRARFVSMNHSIIEQNVSAFCPYSGKWHSAIDSHHWGCDCPSPLSICILLGGGWHTESWCPNSALGVPGWKQTVALPARPLPLPTGFGLGTQKYHLALAHITCRSSLSEQNSPRSTCSKRSWLQNNLLETLSSPLLWEYTVQKFLETDSQDLLSWGVTFRIAKLSKFKL